MATPWSPAPGARLEPLVPGDGGGTGGRRCGGRGEAFIGRGGRAGAFQVFDDPLRVVEVAGGHSLAHPLLRKFGKVGHLDIGYRFEGGKLDGPETLGDAVEDGHMLIVFADVVARLGPGVAKPQSDGQQRDDRGGNGYRSATGAAVRRA